jgi:hypothetical protein
VTLGAHDDSYSWSAGETALGHVPAGLPENGVPTSGQPGEVGHGAARHEPDGALAGQPEEVQQPGAGDIFDRAVRRGHPAQTAVLVPCADQPVGCKGGRVGPSDDHEMPTHKGCTCVPVPA